jgi:hypothetical protein
VLAHLPSLEFLELWQVRKLADLTAVGQAPALRHLWLGSLRNVEHLAWLDGMSTVRGIVLDCMKGLQRIGAVVQLQNLKQLAFVDTRPPRDECLLLKTCKTLKQLAIPPNWGTEVVTDIENALPHCDFDTWTPIEGPYRLRREEFMDPVV